MVFAQLLTVDQVIQKIRESAAEGAGQQEIDQTPGSGAPTVAAAGTG
jgi:hypothetical protein